MDDRDNARILVEQFLSGGEMDEPLRAVRRSATLQRELDTQQRETVVRAAERHTWSEIGAALGVSKQAAHRKFVTALAEELKVQHSRAKLARRTGRRDEAMAATQSMQETAKTIQRVRRLT